MMIHAYVHDVAEAAKTGFCQETVDIVVHYLQNEDGRSDIALWLHKVANTAWLGGHALLWSGSPVVYLFSRN